MSTAAWAKDERTLAAAARCRCRRIEHSSWRAIKRNDTVSEVGRALAGWCGEGWGGSVGGECGRACASSQAAA
eukprot:3374132-Prymnesium_polylepis.1